jgi:DNA-binding LytR/AlgR family response regulator
MNAPVALIAEDEPLLAAHLQQELARAWPELRIGATAGDGLSAARTALELKPDVCFLDIRMPGCTGLESAQAIAEDWPEGAPFPLLVFVTAYDQYAVQAFDAQAVDYLVKPLKADRLAACVARLQQRLIERAPQPALQDAVVDQLRALLTARPVPGTGAESLAQPRLEVIQASVGNTVHMVPIDDVLYFEAADKYVRVITAEREHLIRIALRDLLPQIDSNQFWQVHRGLVVRARAITTAQRDESGKVFLTLRGRPERLTASRLYAHLFKGM